ncbi:hypothetical protein [Ectobacillus funiculus]|uniref:Uncharacterized protein n=1 Tax=Ectobacillus funiculus TaxID=137993 RepID=A0ABV5WCB1_9BACI
MILGMLLFEFGKSLLFNGRIGIVYTIIMVLVTIMFVALGVCGTFVIKIWRMILTREEE